MLELCGATIILWHGVPIYRELLAGNFNRAEPLVKLWATGATALIQTGYWHIGSATCTGQRHLCPVRC